MDNTSDRNRNFRKMGRKRKVREEKAEGEN
jgi:hypothetical protein